ncbi:hypothetical protein [Effusibacillus consociatus]|uniref:Uncharacterized protein n=1 Tax=Effusibacillus consociatus TaxID=1117041 RepID=A0ABV9Q3I3_9BACL
MAKSGEIRQFKSYSECMENCKRFCGGGANCEKKCRQFCGQLFPQEKKSMKKKKK